MPQIQDGVIVVEDTDEEGNSTLREATVSEQNAMILQVLEGQGVL